MSKKDGEHLAAETKLFVENVLGGKYKNIGEAWKAAHPESTIKNASNQAGKVWRSAAVKQYADAIKSKLDRERGHRLAASADVVLERLWAEATQKGKQVENAKPGVLGIGEKAADRIAALRLIGQTMALYSEKVITTESKDDRSSAELIAEIEDAIRKGGNTQPTSLEDAIAAINPPAPEDETIH